MMDLPSEGILSRQRTGTSWTFVVRQKVNRKRLTPYLLKICAFFLTHEDRIREYFEQRARYARDPAKVPCPSLSLGK